MVLEKEVKNRIEQRKLGEEERERIRSKNIYLPAKLSYSYSISPFSLSVQL